MIIPRPRYLEKLAAYRDKDLVKVLTGLLRSGKSTMLNLFKLHLQETGIAASRIVFINFERPETDSLRDPRKLYDHIVGQTVSGEKTYVFLDEIQRVERFEEAVDGLYLHKDIDLYITGSNAYFLSGELATYLSGRYLEIEILPLSFAEYAAALPNESNNLQNLYARYATYGGLPYTLEMGNDDFTLFDYLGGVYNTVVRKDVARQRGNADPILLDSIVKFLIDSIGSPISVKKIADTLTSKGRKITNHTVSDYMQALLDAFVFYRTTRYDLRGRQLLQTQEKYYLSDLGFKYYLFGASAGNVGHILENIVYLELRRRCTQINVGLINGTEIDFVATGRNGVAYYQVSASVLDPATLERELKPLRAIPDNYPKYLLTLDTIGNGSHAGIIQENVLEWLLTGNDL